MATPKDEYPMPVADQLVDAVTKHQILLFIYGHLGYNQIYIVEEDVPRIAFWCPGAIGTFKWVAMPFGFKNAGATYKRAINSIFHGMTAQFIEVYIDDMVIKSPPKAKHLVDMEKAFQRMRIHKLKMNPLKCAFGVSVGNFWGFLVYQRGIKVEKKGQCYSSSTAPKE